MEDDNIQNLHDIFEINISVLNKRIIMKYNNIFTFKKLKKLIFFYKKKLI